MPKQTKKLQPSSVEKRMLTVLLILLLAGLGTLILKEQNEKKVKLIEPIMIEQRAGN